MNRREFMTTVAAAAVTLPMTGMARPDRNSRLKVGLLGAGLRGRVHLKELLRRDDVDVVALCDTDSFATNAALEMIAAARRAKPAVYSGSDRAYETMLSKAGLDAVVIATPWEWHAPQAIAAMQSKVAVGCEVVAGISLDDHWQVLRTQQRTKVPYMLLENVCYRRDVMAVLNMVRQGLFGEIVHLEAGYQHDLRAVKFNSGAPGKPYGGGVEFGEKGSSEARWRTPHSVSRNGELYPSHGIGPCAMWANINRGNRFLRLSSFASKARGLHNYVVKNGGAEHPNSAVRFSLGDVVTTQLVCAGGETITLTHDTSLPRPYSLGFRVQGTEGLWMDVNESLYLEGRSPKPHEWEAAKPWLEKHDHPLWKRFAAQAEGAGHGGMDFFVVHAFIEALKAKAPMPIDIYDAVTWSAITPLSEMSIADNNRTLDFPDFTGDTWAERKPIFAFDDHF